MFLIELIRDALLTFVSWVIWAAVFFLLLFAAWFYFANRIERRRREQERIRSEDDNNRRANEQRLQRENEENWLRFRQQMIDRVIFVSAKEREPGYRINRELGWVSVKTELRSDAEPELKYQAGRMDGNAILKLRSSTMSEEIPGGYNKKGIPWSRIIKVRTWEGLAVSVSRSD